MALKLYSVLTATEINDSTNKIVATHDAVDGTYQIQTFYVSNESDTNFGYSNIVIALTDNAGSDLAISSQTGIYYQLFPIEGSFVTEPTVELPDTETWESAPFSNEISLANIIPGDVVYRFFALRTYVPRGTASKYISEAKITISALEV
jgi:hypothetical protein